MLPRTTYRGGSNHITHVDNKFVYLCSNKFQCADIGINYLNIHTITSIIKHVIYPLISAWILLVLELLNMDSNWSAEFVPIEDEDLANFMDKLEREEKLNTENIPEVVPGVVNSSDEQAPLMRLSHIH